MELFGLRLKALRLNKNLTQEQLGDKLGIVGGSVSGYEKGTIYPSVEVLIEICKYFDVSANYMLGLSNSMDFELSPLSDEQIAIILSIIDQFIKVEQK